MRVANIAIQCFLQPPNGSGYHQKGTIASDKFYGRQPLLNCDLVSRATVDHPCFHHVVDHPSKRFVCSLPAISVPPPWASKSMSSPTSVRPLLLLTSSLTGRRIVAAEHL